MTTRHTRPMAPHEEIRITLTKLADGSIEIRAHSEATKRSLLNSCYVVKGGFECAAIVITPEGVNFDLS